MSLIETPQAVGPVRYADRAPLQRELNDLARISAEQAQRFVETFVTAPSPGIVVAAMRNAHYDSEAAYLHAVADALAEEYQPIARARHVLQIDCPDLAMERHTSFADQPLGDFIAWIEQVVDAINRALAKVPARAGAHARLLGQLRRRRTSSTYRSTISCRFSIAPASARWCSRWPIRATRTSTAACASGRCPTACCLIAGVIDPTTNYVEHPEVVADRIETAARAVGDPQRVLAGTDCGFDTSAGLGNVAEEVVWEKLKCPARRRRHRQ